MSTHMQGKLVVGKPRGAVLPIELESPSIHGLMVADVGFSASAETDEANARRLVACWNACEGVPTDALEQIEGFGKAALPYHELKAQRDELIAVSKGLLEVYGIDDVRQWMALREKARAAIARAEVKP